MVQMAANALGIRPEAPTGRPSEPDVLSDVFETVRLRGSLYFRTDFTAPWGTTVPSLGRAARFHHVVRGHCYISVAAARPVRLEAGDFIVVPGGASHVLSHAPTIQAPPLEDVLRMAGYDGKRVLALGAGDPRASTRLVCGHFTFAEGSDHPLLRALPDMIHIGQAARAQRPLFDALLQLLATHVFQDADGSPAVVNRLSEAVFIEAIRSAGDEAPELQRLVQGFADPRIGEAITLIHRAPGRAWTVEDLARQVGMSRTRFAHQFQERIGVGPITYLAEWRFQRAVRELRTSQKPVAAIAYASGYKSPAAFTRAFSERFGESPRSWRSRFSETSQTI